MNKVAIKYTFILFILCITAGFINSLLSSTLDYISSAKSLRFICSYLFIPIMNNIFLLPGFIVGYIYGANRIILTAVVAFFASTPSIFAVSLNLNLPDIPLAIAMGVSLSIETVVGLFAGAYVSKYMHTSNKSFKPVSLASLTHGTPPNGGAP